MDLHDVFTLWGMIIIAIVCGALTSIVSVIAKQWRKSREALWEASLKEKLIDQGRSADEIERVLRASGRSTAGVEEE